MIFSPLFALSSSTWDSLSDGASLLIVTLVIVAGVLLGYALRGLVGRWQAEAIEKKMKLREDEAESEIKAKLKESEIAARAAVVKAREEFEASTGARRAELEAMADRLAVREAGLDKKSALLDAREETVTAKAEAVAEREAAAQRVAARVEEAEARAAARLEELAHLTHEEARREVLAHAEEAVRADADSLTRRIEEEAREEGEARARALVADAVQRCAVAHLAEVATTTVTLPSPEMKGRIVGRDGRNVRAFEAATGVTLLLDDAPDTVVLSAFDPQRREIARLAMERLLKSGRIHPASVEEAVAGARAAVEEANGEAGAAAAGEAGVVGLSADVLRQMGALRLRTSFTQNVLRHSVEVSVLLGTMAGEMGLDAAKGRRIGFLHDIGKVLTATTKGAHAQLGADFLKAHGEAPDVCAAVAAHHGEEGTNGGVWGVLCAAADAISSARPGARRENAGDYIQRLADLEKLAKAHAGVTNVYAVQAGRDVRVIVDPGAVSDDGTGLLAAEICREISAKIKFPGQIRVTVVREFRATDYAK